MVVGEDEVGAEDGAALQLCSHARAHAHAHAHAHGGRHVSCSLATVEGV